MVFFLNKLQDLFSNIPKDKLLHFFYGYFLVLLFNLVNLQYITIIILVGILAIVKEVIDNELRNSKFSFKDILATLLPALLNFI